jgi:hypothetical protein
MVVNLLKLLDTNIKIISVIAFCLLTAYILLSEASKVTENLYILLSSYSSQAESNNLITNQQNTEGESIYVPPNFGGPDSQYGSGRR